MIFKKQDIPRLKKAISKDLKGARDKMVSKKFDVIILDEIINALAGGSLDAPELARFIRAMPANAELVLTGRGDTRPIESLADYVTYFKKLKHPFDSRARARRGIEF